MDPILLSTAGEVGTEGIIDAEGLLEIDPATRPGQSLEVLNHASSGHAGVIESEEEHCQPLLTLEEDAHGSKEAVLEDAVEPPYELTVYDEYPAPLTEPQRRAFQRHVAQSVRKHTVLCRTSRLIRQGLASLERLVDRLRNEKATLQAQLEGTTGASDAHRKVHEPPQTTPSSAEHPPTKAARSEREDVPSHSTGPAESAAGAPAPPQPSPAKRPSRFGGLLRSAAFANMQKVLSTVQKEETEKFAQVAQSRERIARETKLKLVSEDLESQEAILNPLLGKLDKCTAMEHEAEATVANLLQLMTEMFLQESLYASSFTLKAVDASAVERLTRTRAPVATTAVTPLQEQEQVGQEALPTASGTFEVPFMPAVCTAEVEELIRGQVEEVIASYRDFRERIDPTLAVLEEAEKQRKAKRLEELMNVIGVTNADVLNSTNGLLLGMTAGPNAPFMGSAEAVGGEREGGGILGNAWERPVQSLKRVKQIKAGFGVSDSEEDGDDSEDSLDSFADQRSHGEDDRNDTEGGQQGLLGVSRGGVKRPREEGEGNAVADTSASKELGVETDDSTARDQSDRKLIQSALSALDDFDEMF